MEALVLAAGRGTRMKSERPKVLHEILGRPILSYVLQTLAELGIGEPHIVVGYGAARVRAWVAADKQLSVRPRFVLQRNPKGTAHAVLCARRSLSRLGGELLIWPGDMPLVRLETLKAFLRAHRQSGCAASVLSSLRLDPFGYGRILRAGGEFYGIREETEANETERRIQEVNTGIYLFDIQRLYPALKKVRPENKKHEYYLTDVIEVLVGEGARVAAFPFASSEEGQGINSRTDLSNAMHKINLREIRRHEQKGVTFVAPEQTFVAPGVSIGKDTTIHPWTYIESDVRIGKNCQIGPFAKIRAGSVIGDHTVVGSFVEVTRTHLGKGVMAKHLAYLGDAIVGDGTNIGAGTITANFDGRSKHRTKIGKDVLIGSDTVLVAPVTVGDGAQTGAGSILTRGTRVKKGDVVVGVPARPLPLKRRKRPS